jgi:hypothetical protein
MGLLYQIIQQYKGGKKKPKQIIASLLDDRIDNHMESRLNERIQRKTTPSNTTTQPERSRPPDPSMPTHGKIIHPQRGK